MPYNLFSHISNYLIMFVFIVSIIVLLYSLLNLFGHWATGQQDMYNT